VGRLLPAAVAWIGPGSVMKAISRMSPPHAGQTSGNSSPTRARSFAQAFARGVVRAGLLVRVAAAPRGVTVAPMPTSSDLAPLADVPDRERRDGFSQLVIHAWRWCVEYHSAPTCGRGVVLCGMRCKCPVVDGSRHPRRFREGLLGAARSPKSPRREPVGGAESWPGYTGANPMILAAARRA